MEMLFRILVCLNIILSANAAKILMVFPIPCISHQNVFRQFISELTKRDNELVVITPFKDLEREDSLNNLKEIQINERYLSLRKQQVSTKICKGNYVDKRLRHTLKSFEAATEMIFENDEVRKMIADDVKFDLVIVEGWVRPARAFSHIFRAPVIMFTSSMAFIDEHYVIGSTIHPVLYPIAIQQNIQSTTIFEKISELHAILCLRNIHKGLENFENRMLKRYFDDIKNVNDLNDDVNMLFLNVYPIWDLNRPVPPSVVYGGGMHLKPTKQLPKDLETFLNASIHGVIYVSFGTNIAVSALPRAGVQTMIRVLSDLPYDVLWKWDLSELPAPGANIKIAKWWPQADLLRHPKVKLFVTHCGLQSTDDAIAAGVPLLGIPLMADQWFNAGNYVKHKIGVKVEMDSITEKEFRDAVETVIGNKSYRRNIARFGALLRDIPQSPLQRAVWWTEHVLRHGALHVRAPAHNMHWTEYLEIELLAIVFISVLLLTIVLAVIIFNISRIVWNKCIHFSCIFYNNTHINSGKLIVQQE